ncbi:MAG: hypothetical protein WCT18_02705 [Patescibacteria group bacterium]
MRKNLYDVFEHASGESQGGRFFTLHSLEGSRIPIIASQVTKERAQLLCVLSDPVLYLSLLKRDLGDFEFFKMETIEALKLVFQNYQIIFDHVMAVIRVLPACCDDVMDLLTEVEKYTKVEFFQDPSPELTQKFVAFFVNSITAKEFVACRALAGFFDLHDKLKSTVEKIDPYFQNGQELIYR